MKVEAAEQRIRDIVNSPRRSELLRQDRERWFRLCSAMDVIGDTQLAVRAFLDEPVEKKESDGWSYLVVYGVLQVLYVQQDAARTLATSLGISLELPEELRAIREARNSAIGHPTNYRGGASTAISRISLTSNGFDLLVHARGHSEIRSISVRSAAAQQTQLMGELLSRAVEQLVSDELEHRRRFRDRPLRMTLPSTLGYMVEKLSEGLRDVSSIPFAIGGIESIRDAVIRLQGAVDDRGLTVAYKDSVGETINEVNFVLERIASRLKGGLSDWAQLDAEVYSFFLRAKVHELQELAAEIDREYDSDEV